MSAAELLTTVVVVTVLVTVILVAIAHLGRRLGSRGEPESGSGHSGGSWYFVRYVPGGEPDAD